MSETGRQPEDGQENWEQLARWAVQYLERTLEEGEHMHKQMSEMLEHLELRDGS